MDKPLVEQNRATVAVFVAVNLILGYAVLVGLPQSANARDIAQSVLSSASAMTIIGIIAVIGGGVLTLQQKLKFVYFLSRFWPAPSYHAFTPPMGDERCDPPAIASRLNIPMEAGPAASRAWYGLYVKHQNTPQVLQDNRAFLMMLEMNVFASAALATFVIWGAVEYFTKAANPIWQHPGYTFYAWFVLAQFIAVRVAARTYGINVIRDVLAAEGSAP